MTGHSNPYAVLGVTRTATPAEITHAFRAKLRSLHPDTRSSGVGDAELREVLTAYGQLRDPGRRAEYDRAAAVAPPRPPSPDSGPVAPTCTRTNSVGPVQIPVTHRRTDQSPRAERPLWAGPVRRHL
ncbi:J domain-containing protein [Mycobacterium sp. JS623]|uniref:J domain-containing protein n=1 Tax=Mycobacterium sp. JS623 TaxID=212767 RepID=UPI00059D1484|nr:J domain-containing protein [Mycobacterium sp. JS623]